MVCETSIQSVSISPIVSLNPCFNGRWSARFRGFDDSQEGIKVLILVLMEDGLRAGVVVKVCHGTFLS